MNRGQGNFPVLFDVVWGYIFGSMDNRLCIIFHFVDIFIYVIFSFSNKGALAFTTY